MSEEVSGLAVFPRTFVNALTGYIVDAVGWSQFFRICAMLELPGMLLLKVAPWKSDEQQEPSRVVSS